MATFSWQQPLADQLAEQKKAFDEEQAKLQVQTQVQEQNNPLRKAVLSISQKTDDLARFIATKEAASIPQEIPVKSDNTFLIIAGVAILGLLIWKGKALK